MTSPMTSMTGLFDVLDHHIRTRPDATALVATGQRVPATYATLGRWVGDAAADLAAAGLRPGDVVALVELNTAEFVVALLAAARCGLIVAPLDPALAEAEMADRLTRLGARAVLTGPGALADGSHRVHATGTRATVEATGHGAPRAAADLGLGPDDAMILFTSGTTGRPKMVPWTHTNLAASVHAICATYHLGGDDATVAAMPFFHGHGLVAVLLSTLASGGKVLLPAGGRFSARTFWADMRAAQATWFTAVPTIHQILLQRPDEEHPPLRFVRSCSAPLDAATAEQAEHRFGAPILEAYGMTETTHQAASRRAHRHDPRASVGPASGAARLRIVGAEGRECAPGETGEVWVSGPAVVRGYLADPEHTAEAFIEGWFRTGDLGALDRDGNLQLTGRIKNIINRGGEKISPEHVEGVLTGCDGVFEAVVFAIPDATYGEQVGAAVVPSDLRASADDIVAECRTKLAPYEVPSRLDIVESLPHTAKGAIDRQAVTSQLAH
ncbi:FadD7 family fatty acid--CoA ligase [Mycolicibacterium goodii]|uniref:FadD7 family fatty acid--CoA ligase n=1 Tax=Mycolicibacterium goodii TaxID=134601 RepID=UPI001BDD5084|nr:FadD7 family fatty acid--CoA ligase [Mycolicibacterium goodii]MBU8830087.1 FadD7 family fatty acid--CoA ligase [Mycolicibacterium goodii]ULN46419.1 FadD7 family fatty acid--CoA ligase [Mycolicibacterium goodii]